MMAKIYDFNTGEVVDDFPSREPILKRITRKSIGRASLALTQESLESTTDRINQAIGIALAVAQARHEYELPGGTMTLEELQGLIKLEVETLDRLSPAERQQVEEFIKSVSSSSEEEIS